MVRRVQRAGTTLFDPRVDLHHHLVCTVCGSMEDLDFSLDTGALEHAAGEARLRARAHRGRRARPLRILPRRGLGSTQQPAQRRRDVRGSLITCAT